MGVASPVAVWTRWVTFTADHLPIHNPDQWRSPALASEAGQGMQSSEAVEAELLDA